MVDLYVLGITTPTRRIGWLISIEKATCRYIALNVSLRYRSVLGCFVIEGYGQTENCGVATMSLYGDTVPGHVGVPAPGVHVKLNDVPDMNYNASEGKGEVSVSWGRDADGS